MKKYSRIIVAVLAMVTLLSLVSVSAGANSTLKPTDYSAYGQQTLKAEFGGVPNTVDGKIEENEYTNVFKFTSETAGIEYASLVFPEYPQEIRVYLTEDTDYIYLGLAIQQNYYKYRSGNTAGSFITFTLGFDMGDEFYHCMNRNTLTFNLVDDGSLFKMDTIMTYDATGKATTKYSADCFAAAAGTRDEDAKMTYYEAQLKKDVLAANNGVESIGSKYYIFFEIANYLDATSTKTSMYYRNKLSDEAKDAIRAADGWVATFSPNIISMEGNTPETTEEVKTEAPAETTLPTPDTTAPAAPETKPAETPVTGDSFTAIAVLAVVALAAIGSALVLRRKNDN